MDYQQQLALLRDLDPEQLSTTEVRAVVGAWLLLVEELVRRAAEREAELRQLREERARLKGQSPRPKFPPTCEEGSASGSSEQERRAREPGSPGRRSTSGPHSR